MNPDEAVALGAAIQAAMKERNEAVKEVILTDVCSFTLGTEVVVERGRGNFESGHFCPIIDRNTVIPASRTERFYTVHDDQTKITVNVLQGESRYAANNLLLGEMTISVPKNKAGAEAVDVTYTYDINSILEVEVLVLSTGEKKKQIIKGKDNDMSDAQIEERMRELSYLKIHPRDKGRPRRLQKSQRGGESQNQGDQRENDAGLPHFAVEEVDGTQEECSKGNAGLAAGLVHAQKLDQIVQAGAAQIAGPVPGLDAVDGVIGAQFPAEHAAKGIGAAGGSTRACAGISAGGGSMGTGCLIPGVNGTLLLGTLCRSIVRIGQGNAAVVAGTVGHRVGGSAVGADAGIVYAGNDVRLPFKAGTVLVRMDADAGLEPAGTVIGGAAVGADDDVVPLGKNFVAYGTMVPFIICHSIASVF